jgi:hypothetical protein
VVEDDVDVLTVSVAMTKMPEVAFTAKARKELS